MQAKSAAPLPALLPTLSCAASKHPSAAILGLTSDPVGPLEAVRCVLQQNQRRIRHFAPAFFLPHLVLLFCPHFRGVRAKEPNIESTKIGSAFLFTTGLVLSTHWSRKRRSAGNRGRPRLRVRDAVVMFHLAQASLDPPRSGALRLDDQVQWVFRPYEHEVGAVLPSEPTVD